MAKVCIKGMKISGELCLVQLRKAASANHLLPAFCGILAGSQINTPYLQTEYHDDGIQAACCVNTEHQALLKRLVDADPVMRLHIAYIPQVGLLTLFPHQSSLKLFGLSLRTLIKADLRVLGMASSIGALTYVLDYSQMDMAADVLKSCFELAKNHSPFRAEFLISQGTQSRPGHPE